MPYHPIDVQIGLRQRQRRTLLGMSQGKLATAVGLTFQQIQKYERGANRLGASKLFEFAKVLDVPVFYFFETMPPEATRFKGRQAWSPTKGQIQRSNRDLAQLPLSNCNEAFVCLDWLPKQGTHVFADLVHDAARNLVGGTVWLSSLAQDPFGAVDCGVHRRKKLGAPFFRVFLGSSNLDSQPRHEALKDRGGGHEIVQRFPQPVIAFIAHHSLPSVSTMGISIGTGGNRDRQRQAGNLAA